MKVVKISITPEILLEMFTEKDFLFKITKGLPVGARLAGFAIDHNRNCINVFAAHDSFRDVKNHETPPDFTPTYERLPPETKQLAENKMGFEACPPHEWDRSGEKCLKCGMKDWMT
jgi:hypothetical protein